MATVQRIEIIGVLFLVLGAMSLSAAGAIGLITFQVPHAIGEVWDAASEIAQWVRWLIVAAVAVRIVTHRTAEAE